MWHPNQTQPETAWEATIDALYIEGSRELDRQKRVDFYHRAQEIIAENAPLIYTTLAERLTATRNFFGNTTPTLYGLWDIRLPLPDRLGESLGSFGRVAGEPVSVFVEGVTVVPAYHSHSTSVSLTRCATGSGSRLIRLVLSRVTR